MASPPYKDQGGLFTCVFYWKLQQFKRSEMVIKSESQSIRLALTGKEE